MINIAVIGCGHISRKMANTLRLMKQNGEAVHLYAAAARELSRAQTFAQAEGFEKAYGSYEEMLRDENVDLVYIGTPHSHHFEQILLCLNHGKHVLCEKAFTLNASQARKAISLAREKGLLLAEAIWPRYMPSRELITGLIAEIGGAQYIASDLHFEMEQIPRIAEPALAGGGLLDIGVYAITFALMYMHAPITRVETCAALTKKGVDRQSSITLFAQDGCTAMLSCGIAANGGQHTLIAGPKGRIVVDNVFNPMHVTVATGAGERVVEMPPQLTGYEYEVRACIRAMEKGESECPEMPHSEILRVMELMDFCRAQWGMVYPQEKEQAGGEQP